MSYKLPTKTQLSTIGNSPQWFKVHKEYTDFSDTGSSKTITLFTPSAGQFISNVRVDVTKEFGGGTAIAATLTVQQINTGDFIASASVFTIPLPLGLPGVTPVLDSFSSPNPLTATLTATGDTLNHLTKGKIDVYYCIQTLP